MAIGLSCGYDANSIIPLCKYDQENVWLNTPYRDPSVFVAIVRRIGKLDSLAIIEHEDRFQERNSVFEQVRLGFYRIPLEIH